MGCYNNLKQQALCPKCNQEADLIFQMHTASSFSGDNSGMFNLRSYKIGDNLAWWKPDNQQFSKWSDSVTEEDSLDNDGFFVKEHCFGQCLSCKCELTTDISIRNFRIEKIGDIRCSD